MLSRHFGGPDSWCSIKKEAMCCLHLRIGDRFTHRVTVSDHGKRILKPKTLKSILKAAGLTVSRFNNYLRG